MPAALMAADGAARALPSAGQRSAPHILFPIAEAISAKTVGRIVAPSRQARIAAYRRATCQTVAGEEKFIAARFSFQGVTEGRGLAIVYAIKKGDKTARCAGRLGAQVWGRNVALLSRRRTSASGVRKQDRAIARARPIALLFSFQRLRAHRATLAQPVSSRSIEAVPASSRPNRPAEQQPTARAASSATTMRTKRGARRRAFRRAGHDRCRPRLACARRSAARRTARSTRSPHRWRWRT